MTVTVREFRPADAEGAAHARRVCVPFMLATGASMRYDALHLPPEARFRILVAEEDGEIIGTAQTSVAHDSPRPGIGSANVYVRPDRLGRGAGTLLLDASRERLLGLGVTELFSWVPDEAGSRAFAERRGFTASRRAHFLHRDLTRDDLPPLQDPPPGVALLTGLDFADDPRPVFELDAAAMLDEPGDVDVEFTDLDAWKTQYWHHPLTDHALTVIAAVDGRPVSFTEARTDGLGRYSTGMTGTLREHRGRGLAKLVKNHALHRAREAGCTEAFTGNDTGNGPMLAVNTWLGYEIGASEVRYVRGIG